MQKIKLVLLGTPQFAVPIFEELINNFEVLAIVSQPDRPANRGYKLAPTPVKELALKHNVKLFQPEKIGELYEEIKNLNPDFIVSAAFGQYVPTKILDLPNKGSINVHGSLLPKYRGAAPVQYTLLNNDKEAGITLIYMTKEMDAGDMIAKASFDISLEDTSKELFEKLSLLARDNITKWINDLYEGKIVAEKQDSTKVILSPKIPKEFAEFYLTDTTLEAWNKIRALNDNPGAFIIYENKRLKVYRASLEPIKNSLVLPMKDGKLYCYEYQFESKKRVKIER